jgi:hypothetical protein
MQTGCVQALGAYIGMTAQAAICHGSPAPERNMALVTLSGQAGMRGRTAKGGARYGIEPTRAEKNPTHGEGNDDHNQYHHKGGDISRPG